MIKRYVGEFFEHFRHDWNHNRHLFFLEMFGMIFVLSGFIGMSLLNRDMPLLLFFGLDFCGAVCMLIAAHIRRSGFIVLFQCFFITASIVGVTNHLLFH